MKLNQLISTTVLLSILACGPAAKNDTYPIKRIPTETSSMSMLDAKDLKAFERLPLLGNIENGKKFWSGNHWPLNQGSINLRWNSREAGFDNLTPSKDQAMLMSELELMELSPAEKFDLLLGRYDFPLVKEVQGRINTDALPWEGIGNGWALASVHHKEPVPKTLINPDGISVPFGSADIKALISYYYAYHFKAQLKQLGSRCEQRGQGCGDDLNAGEFHTLLTNRLGLRQEALVIDIDPTSEVWNHPVVAFESKLQEERAPTDDDPLETKRVVKMMTTVHYVANTERSWWPVLGRWQQMVANRLYQYELFIDQEGNIIGGAWQGVDRPDFVWLMPRTVEFEHSFRGLDQLIE